MPGRLTVFGCLHLPISADDLTLPAAFGIVIRFVALFASAALLAIGIALGQATGADIAFLVLTLAICIITHVLYVALYRVSGRGDLLAYEERTAPTVFVYHCLALAYLCEFAIGAFGVALLATNVNPHPVLMAVEIIAVVGLGLDLCVMFFIVAALAALSRGKRPRKLNGSSYSNFIFSALKLMSYACCGLFGSLPATAAESDFVWSEISHVLHAFLKDSLMDFTVTDLLCAVLLVRMEQQEAERARLAAESQGGSASIRRKSQALPSGTLTAESQAVLKEFDEFAPYMVGIYGWKLQAFTSPLEFIRTFPGVLHRKFFGDGTEVEYSVFQHTIGGRMDHSKRQIVFSSFTSYLGQAVPYTITVDHERKAVVISVRGTMSVSDIALDLMCEPVTLEHAERNWGVKQGSKHYVHGGMLRVASRIRADIEKQQILHRLFRSEARAAASHDALQVSAEDRESFLKAMGRSKKQGITEDMMFKPECYVNDRELNGMDCSEYRLICCGHSLGSCMAAILTLLLRDEFPRVRCLAYSCVSSIFSAELAEESSEYIASITLGKDIFGRLSWRSMSKLRERILHLIHRCRVNKFTILTSFFRSPRPGGLEDFLYPVDQVPHALERNKVAGWIQTFRDEAESRDTSKQLAIQRVPMFMPGKVFYLEKVSTELVGAPRAYLCCTRAKQSNYVSKRVMNRAEIQEVHITSRLILDHMPDYLARVIHDTIEEEDHEV